MRVRVSCVLDCSADRAWEQVQRPVLLNYVAWPLGQFRPERPWPERWEAGEHRAEFFLFGLFPFGEQVIGIEFPPPAGATRRLRDNGHGGDGTMGHIKQWDHLVEIRPHESDPARARYRDTVDLDAGWLTVPLWCYASLYYRWRQVRWRYLARTGFRALDR